MANPTQFVGKDGSGNDIRFVRYDGLTYPIGVVDIMESGGLAEQLAACRDMDVRDTDVFISAYVKSGMHWLWEIVHMLLNNTSEYATLSKEHSMLDFRSKEHVANLSDKRLLNLHFPVRYFPNQAIKKGCPIIHIMRNPKDLFVSYYNHQSAMPAYNDKCASFSTFLPMMLGKNGFYFKQAWYEYELEWEMFAKDNSSYPILFLYYEDLKENLEKWVGIIAKFLKLKVTDELIARIASNNEISKLRQGSKEKRPDDILHQFVVDGQPIMYRKGMVGDWKNWFTVADNEKMDAWLEENLVNTDLKFRYTL